MWLYNIEGAVLCSLLQIFYEADKKVLEPIAEEQGSETRQNFVERQERARTKMGWKYFRGNLAPWCWLWALVVRFYKLI